MKAIATLLALLLTVGSVIAQPTYLQKTVTLYSLDSTELPPEVLVPAQPRSWTHWERGPVDSLKVLTEASSGVTWLGSRPGAVRFDSSAAHPWERWQYFASRRWLPDDQVEQIYVDEGASNETVWIRTASGVARLEWQPMTLEEKARHFEEVTEAHHIRHGFVSDALLIEPGDFATSVTTDSDNDGLWTAMYLAAQAYRYGVTGESDARTKAHRALEALMRLETIDPIPGFYARTYRTFDESHPHQDGGEWHPVGDGKTEWKGDTSSDESVGHYYAYAMYYDLVADEEEKDEIRTYVRRITDYLIENEYDLIDVDGEPTRWGRWGEDYYETPEGDYEKALRSLELLSFLKTTHHITGDSKYQEAYLDRVQRGYARYTLDYRRWGSEEWEINFSDDELYFLSIDPLLQYEKDPVLREVYLEGMRFTWSRVQPEANPLWTYIYVARGGDIMTPLMQAEARRTLERIPLDLIDWDVRNSHRRDVVFNQNPDRHGASELNRILPPDERRLHKHNGNPYRPDGGRGGRRIEAPTYWLLPYWMGRYHGWTLSGSPP